MSNLLLFPSRAFLPFLPPSPLQTLTPPPPPPLSFTIASSSSSSSSSSPLSTLSSSPFSPKPITTFVARSSWQPPKYVYPDPIPEFAKSETAKFRGELRRKLVNGKEDFGEDVDTVINICAEIFSEFLHKEYGGPGTLLVEPFTDMLLALKEKKLPGASAAARAALLWAQNYVDKDWETWTSQQFK